MAETLLISFAAQLAGQAIVDSVGLAKFVKAFCKAIKDASEQSFEFTHKCGQQYILMKDLRKSIKLRYESVSRDTGDLINSIMRQATDIVWKLYDALTVVFERRRGWAIKWAQARGPLEKYYEQLVGLRRTLEAAERGLRLKDDLRQMKRQTIRKANIKQGAVVGGIIGAIVGGAVVGIKTGHIAGGIGGALLGGLVGGLIGGAVGWLWT